MRQVVEMTRQARDRAKWPQAPKPTVRRGGRCAKQSQFPSFLAQQGGSPCKTNPTGPARMVWLTWAITRPVPDPTVPNKANWCGMAQRRPTLGSVLRRLVGQVSGWTDDLEGRPTSRPTLRLGRGGKRAKQSQFDSVSHGGRAKQTQFAGDRMDVKCF